MDLGLGYFRRYPQGPFSSEQGLREVTVFAYAYDGYVPARLQLSTLHTFSIVTKKKVSFQYSDLIGRVSEISSIFSSLFLCFELKKIAVYSFWNILRHCPGLENRN
jgi:hypothetical protein